MKLLNNSHYSDALSEPLSPSLERAVADPLWASTSRARILSLVPLQVVFCIGFAVKYTSKVESYLLSWQDYGGLCHLYACWIGVDYICIRLLLNACFTLANLLVTSPESPTSLGRIFVAPQKFTTRPCPPLMAPPGLEL